MKKTLKTQLVRLGRWARQSRKAIAAAVTAGAPTAIAVLHDGHLSPLDAFEIVVAVITGGSLTYGIRNEDA